MNVLDENIDEPQRQRLVAWKLHVRQIGVELGRLGMKDRNEIIPLLHSLRRPTLFTSDQDFYRPDWRHAGYCLVYLDVPSNAKEIVIGAIIILAVMLDVIRSVEIPWLRRRPRTA